MKSAVGIEIGSTSIKVIEIAPKGKSYQITSLSEASISIGSISGGEIVDMDTVVAILASLWESTNIKSKTIIAGVSNADVFLRKMPLPSMPISDVKTALPFEVGDYIPISIDESNLNFKVIDVPPDSETIQILAIAAKSSMVESYLELFRLAKIPITDLTFTPLTYSSILDNKSDQTTAFINIGASSVSLVIEKGTATLFSRVQEFTPNFISTELVEALNINIDQADSLKMGEAIPVASEPGNREIIDTITNEGILTILSTITGSIDYFSEEFPEDTLDTMVIMGGGVLLPGLIPRIEESFPEITITSPSLFSLLDTSPLELPPDLQYYGPFTFSSVAGLALSCLKPDLGIISLLPSSVSEARKDRKNKMLVGASLATLVLILLAIWGYQENQLSNQQSLLSNATARESTLQSNIGQYSDIVSLNSKLTKQKTLISSALGNDIAWTTVINSISKNMPSTVWLVSIKGSVPTTGPTIAVSAKGLNQQSATYWLAKMAQVPYIAHPWVSSSTSSVSAASTTFASTANLSSKALSNRATQYLNGQL